ncbi:protein singles bar [Daktulosphaira vitifoliae]|uniref:protein singles bar n=1 Tax=Daktulosphaira vitifoliae TaxID=58002 RepID=UPI0021A9F0E1|nr:protein singles bar [Daktulosphaira vitifoliae]
MQVVRMNSCYRPTAVSCMLCSCFNTQYFTTSFGILKIIEIVLCLICQCQLMSSGNKYLPTTGTTYESFLTTVSGCLMTTTVISASYLLSKKTEVLVRSSLFECFFGIFASFCFISCSSLIALIIYTILYPVLVILPFSSFFTSIILAYALGFVLGVLYAIDAYWAFKYYNGY